MLLPSCIKRNALFTKLPTGSTAKLISVIRLVSFDPGDVLVMQGRQMSGMSCLFTGRLVRSTIPTDEEAGEGVEATSRVLQPPASFGEAAVLGLNTSAAATVRALTPSEVYVIPQDSFLESFGAMPQAMDNMIQQAARLQEQEQAEKQQQQEQQAGSPAKLNGNNGPKASPNVGNGAKGEGAVTKYRSPQQIATARVLPTNNNSAY